MENKVVLNQWIFYVLSGTSFLGIFMLAFCYLVVSGTIKIG